MGSACSEGGCGQPWGSRPCFDVPQSLGLPFVDLQVLPFVGVGPGGLLQAIQEDGYYLQLAMATIPTTVFFIYFNWTCMKLYKHNS